MQLRNTSQQAFTAAGLSIPAGGSTEVPDTSWPTVQQDPAVQAALASGALEAGPSGEGTTGGASAPPEATPAPTPTQAPTPTPTQPAGSTAQTARQDLSRLSEADAAAVVGRTTDRNTLGQWARIEQRRSVVDAINAQLDATARR